jgi:chromate transporter
VWIFVGAPWVERLRSVAVLSSALAAITAAVLGVIANLGVWFAVQVLFSASADVAAGPVTVLVPEWGSLDTAALAIAGGAAVAIFRFRAGLGWVLAGAAACGAAVRLLA